MNIFDLIRRIEALEAELEMVKAHRDALRVAVRILAEKQDDLKDELEDATQRADRYKRQRDEARADHLPAIPKP